MKKDKLYEIVANVVEAGNVDKQELAVALMTSGASLAMVNREMPKALAQNGIVADVSVMSVVREAIAEELELEDDDRTMVIDKYDDVVEWANVLSCQYEVPEANCVKAIRKALGKDAPSKPKLGKTKQAIIAYLVKYPKGNIEGLAEYLYTERDLSEEKALREARMNFSFAKACFDAN